MIAQKNFPARSRKKQFYIVQLQRSCASILLHSGSTEWKTALELNMEALELHMEALELHMEASRMKKPNEWIYLLHYMESF